MCPRTHRMGFQVICKGNDLAAFPGAGNLAGTELRFDNISGFQFAQHDDLISFLEDVVPNDVE